MWISRFFSTESTAYVAWKGLHNACAHRGPKLDKKSSSGNSRGFAHTLLWICMGLSTRAIARRHQSATNAGNKAISGIQAFAGMWCRKFGCCWAFGIIDPDLNWKMPPPLARSQVYPQMHVYRIVVVVNGMPLLWISRDSSTASRAYGAYKRVVCPCMCPLEKLDNISRSRDSMRFPHSVPVDMQMLIHSLRTSVFLLIALVCNPTTVNIAQAYNGFIPSRLCIKALR
jgi:hypothetical protein